MAGREADSAAADRQSRIDYISQIHGYWQDLVNQEIDDALRNVMDIKTGGRVGFSKWRRCRNIR